MPNHLHIRRAHLILRHRRHTPFTPLQRINKEGVHLLCFEPFLGPLGAILGHLALRCALKMLFKTLVLSDTTSVVIDVDADLRDF